MASRDSYQIDGLTPLASLDGMQEAGIGILILWGESHVEHSRSSEPPFPPVCTLKDVVLHFYLRAQERWRSPPAVAHTCATTTSLWAHLLDDLWTYVPKDRLLWLLEVSKYWVQKNSSANHTAWQRIMLLETHVSTELSWFSPTSAFLLELGIL